MEKSDLKEALRNALDVFKFYNARKRKNDIIKEENVKIKIVVPILQELGWMSGNMEDVEFEYPCPPKKKKISENVKRVDCCLFEKDLYGYNLKFFIELKAYKENNPEIDGVGDLREYCLNGDASYGVLTDGTNWELYGPFSNNKIDYIEYNFDDNNSDSNKKDEFFYPEAMRCQFCFCKCNKNICTIGNVKQIYEDTIKELSIEITSIDNVKEFIISFLQKLGWKVDENNEEGKNYLVIKYKDTSIVVMIKPPKYWSGRSQIKDSLKSSCKEKKVCFGVLTNGKRWAFFKYSESNKEKPFLLKSVELRDDDKNIDQVADFLSMFSKGNIKNLHNMITGSKILDCILADERNQELKEELLYVKEYDEKIEDLAKKLYNKLLEMRLKSVELRDDDKSTDQVTDFLSMFSKGNIENLHNMITGSKILDCILADERNKELKEELLYVKEYDEKIEALIKKLQYKVLAMNPDIKVPGEYLKSYIRWYGMENTGKPEKKILKYKVKFTKEKGKLYVKCDGKEIEGSDSTDIFRKTLKKIGLDNVAKSDVKNCNVPVVADKKYSVPSSEKSSYRPIDGYYVMFQGAPKTMADLIIKIKCDLLDKLNSNSIENSDNLREKLDRLFVDII